MKKRLMQIVCLLLIASCLTGLCLADGAPQTEDLPAVLAQFPFVKVSSQGGNLTKVRTEFLLNDGLFFLDNDTLSPELAKISVALAAAAYDWSDLKATLSQMPGFTFADFDYQTGGAARKGNWDKTHTLEDNDFVRYAIAVKKNVVFCGEPYIIYCVPVQGTRGGYDWNSNFNIGDGSNHAGFYGAHNEIMQELYDRMQSDEAEYDAAHTIVWTMGHSRGAAVSNIVAGELTGGYCPSLALDFSGLVTPDRVFSYNFACPNVSRNSRVTSSSFSNIHNFNSQDDLIPIVPMEDWGYERYGETVVLGDVDRENHLQQFSRVVKHAYSGTQNTPYFIEQVLLDYVPNQAESNSVICQGILRGIAFLLNDGKSLKGFYQSVCAFISDHAWDIIQSYFPDPGEYYDYLFTLDQILPDYIADTYYMDEAEFAIWLANHKSQIEEMESMFHVQIGTKEDLQEAAGLVAAELLDTAMNHKLHPLTVDKLTEAAGALAAIMWGEDGQPKLFSSIWDGHAVDSYVLWINARYCGYAGWYGYQSSVPKVFAVPRGVVSIGTRCFMDAALSSLSMQREVMYICDEACFGAEELSVVFLNSGLVSIGTRAFSG